MWAAGPDGKPRTSNGAESFHSRYNKLFYHGHPPLHTVLNELLDHQLEAYTKMRSIERKVPARIDAKTAKTEKFVEEAYREFLIGGGISNVDNLKKYLFKVGARYRATKVKK